MFLHIEHTEVVRLGHGQTFGRAHGGAQSAEAALAHVDVKLSGIDAFWSSIRGLSKFLSRFNWFYRYAIHRADLCALVAHNAIVNFIV